MWVFLFLGYNPVFVNEQGIYAHLAPFSFMLERAVSGGGLLSFQLAIRHIPYGKAPTMLRACDLVWFASGMNFLGDLTFLFI